jgi:integrase
MMWNSARAWGYVAHDPFNGLVLPKRGLVRTFTFSLEDTQRIIASASEPHKTFYSILAETGIRGSEICALRVADLDLENAVIHVRQSVWRGQIQTVKSRKGNRRFPISAGLVERLRAYLRTRRPNSLGLLFARKNGTPSDHSLVRKRKFHPLLKKLGIPQCGFHAFRHGNATLLDQIGAPWQSDRIGQGMPKRKPRWGTRTRSRQTNAELQMNLGTFCTLLHEMNKTKGQRNIR